MQKRNYQKKERRVKPRFKITVKAQIKAQLIGSDSKYEFVTKDISESGMLIQGKFKTIFNKQSILEVWLMPDNCDEIFFYAKFVRDADKNCIGIKIIDIDKKNYLRYHEFIQKYAGEQSEWH